MNTEIPLEELLEKLPEEIIRGGEEWNTAIRLAEAGFQTGDRETLKAARDRLAGVVGMRIANEMMVNRATWLEVERQKQLEADRLTG